MLALHLWQDLRCHRCGGDLTETTDPANDGSPGNSAYRAQEPVRCHRCTALAVSEERYRKNDHPHALIHRVQLQPPRIRRPT
jgi:hypothetical protein